MAANGNTRLVLVAGVAAFIAGCWVGMGSDTSGQPFCVVTDATAAQHPGMVSGQLAEQPASGCLPGEQEVCGRYEGSGDEQHFVSDRCSGD
jgi:hypothetical protein